MRLLKGHRQFTTSDFSNSRKKILWYCSFTQLICGFFWFNGHLGECGFGEFRLSLLPSPVCAFQSTNRPQGRKGVYFQGSAPMIPFTFVIAFMLRPIISPSNHDINSLWFKAHIGFVNAPQPCPGNCVLSCKVLSENDVFKRTEKNTKMFVKHS